MHRRLRFGLLGGFALVGPIAAQEPPQPRYQATWWTVDDGLPGNWVPDLTEDGAGRLCGGPPAPLGRSRDAPAARPLASSTS